MPLPVMPSSFWVASTKPEAGTKASLAMPTIRGRAGFAGMAVMNCWKGHYTVTPTGTPGREPNGIPVFGST